MKKTKKLLFYIEFLVKDPDHFDGDFAALFQIFMLIKALSIKLVRCFYYKRYFNNVVFL